MDSYNIYKEISDRTDGDIYIGVVGPVRTGKSTFIKKFMDMLVIPNIDNQYKRERAIDELPQSAHGKTIMTTEPKFVPNEAVEITLDDNATFNVRLIDCVGYVVPSAMGYIEGDEPRMVHTPWFDDEIPFAQAAELGTKKVITDHSTIGLLVTTDGTVTELDREDYVQAEERVVKELKDINKPFIIILNSAYPENAATIQLQKELEMKYEVPVMTVNCATLQMDSVNGIIERVLYEFPLTEVTVNLPPWMSSLPADHWLKTETFNLVKESMKGVTKIRETKRVVEMIENNDNIANVMIDGIDLGKGIVTIDVPAKSDLFYKILGETSKIDIDSEDKLMKFVIEMGQIKRDYDKIAPALYDVRTKGYGIVSPTIDELSLEEPEIIKQGSRYGIRLKASAPSMHFIRADIETEVSPIVGTEKQSEELIHYLLKEFDEDPGKIWESNIFGKSLHELVNEGLHNKLERMPEEAQFKLQETLQKIINEGSGGLICIIL